MRADRFRCTVGNICSAFKRKSVDTGCLSSNRDVSVITQNECGNGIVETGEDCDCGGTEACGTNSCCDPTTCKFKGNAVCEYVPNYYLLANGLC